MMLVYPYLLVSENAEDIIRMGPAGMGLQGSEGSRLFRQHEIFLVSRKK